MEIIHFLWHMFSSLKLYISLTQFQSLELRLILAQISFSDVRLSLQRAKQTGHALQCTTWAGSLTIIALH